MAKTEWLDVHFAERPVVKIGNDYYLALSFHNTLSAAKKRLLKSDYPENQRIVRRGKRYARLDRCSKPRTEKIKAGLKALERQRRMAI